MSRSEQDVRAEYDWTPWLLLDDVAPLMAWGTQQTYDELAGTLTHLRDLGLAQFGEDEGGGLHFRVRMDDAGRALALLDDHAYASRN